MASGCWFNITGADFGSLGIFLRPPSTIYPAPTESKRENETRSQSYETCNRRSESRSDGSGTYIAADILRLVCIDIDLASFGLCIPIKLQASTLPPHRSLDRNQLLPCRATEIFNCTGHSALVKLENDVPCGATRACNWYDTQRGTGVRGKEGLCSYESKTKPAFCQDLALISSNSCPRLQFYHSSLHSSTCSSPVIRLPVAALGLQLRSSNSKSFLTYRTTYRSHDEAPPAPCKTRRALCRSTEACRPESCY